MEALVRVVEEVEVHLELVVEAIFGSYKVNRRKKYMYVIT